MKQILLAFFFFVFTVGNSQEYFPKNTGVKTSNLNYTAFTNAKIYISPSKIIDNGTLLIQKGKVVGVGTNVRIPSNSIKIDLKGKTIYPSFIDIYSSFGIEVPKGGGFNFMNLQYDTKRKGFYWNEHIMPETNAVEHYKYDSKKAKDLLNTGFGVVNTHLQNGIVRGTGVLVALNSDSDDNTRILSSKSAQYLSFKRRDAP